MNPSFCEHSTMTCDDYRGTTIVSVKHFQCSVHNGF